MIVSSPLVDRDPGRGTEHAVGRPQDISLLRPSDEQLRFYDLCGFEPFEPWQMAFLWACERFRFVHSGSGGRGGKSVIGGKYAAYRTVLFPGHQTWLVGETYDATRKEFEYAYDAICIELVQRIPGFKYVIEKAVNNPKQGDMEIRLRHPFNSWIRCRSADNLNSLLSEELDLIVLCEGSQIPALAWETRLNQRISSRLGQVIAPTTGAGMNWLVDTFFTPAVTDMSPPALGYGPVAGYSHTASSSWKRRFDDEVRAEWVSSYYTQIYPAFDNPYYPPEEAARHYQEAKESGDWHAYYEQVLGLFHARTGLVIPQYVDALVTADAIVRRFDWGRC